MPPAVIADAENRRSGRESLLAAHLARVDRELAVVEQEKRGLREERDALTAQRTALLEREGRIAEREAVLRKRLDDKLAERLREARAEVDEVVTRLRTKADALADQAEKRAHGRATVLSTGEVGTLRAEARAALGAIESTIDSSASSTEAAGFDQPPAIGETVLLASFGAEGIVRGFSGADVDVEVRGKRMRVPLAGLRKAGSRPPASSGKTTPVGRATGAKLGTASGGLATVPTREIVLVGSTVDAAVDRVEKFLDDALLNDDRRLRIVHGHGTGRLREAMRAFFRKHPLVASVSPAADNEGGDGATIVELKD
jgi:DNA mismatch repair protein MutS2